jgi:hypothetical protein
VFKTTSSPPINLIRTDESVRMNSATLVVKNWRHSSPRAVFSVADSVQAMGI